MLVSGGFPLSSRPAAPDDNFILFYPTWDELPINTILSVNVECLLRALMTRANRIMTISNHTHPVAHSACYDDVFTRGGASCP